MELIRLVNYIFTKEVLEDLLDDIYKDGFSDGKLAAQATMITYLTNDPDSTRILTLLNPYTIWQGPNDVPPTISSSGSSYTTSTTTAGKGEEYEKS